MCNLCVAHGAAEESLMALQFSATELLPDAEDSFPEDLREDSTFQRSSTPKCCGSGTARSNLEKSWAINTRQTYLNILHTNVLHRHTCMCIIYIYFIIYIYTYAMSIYIGNIPRCSGNILWCCPVQATKMLCTAGTMSRRWIRLTCLLTQVPRH